MLKLPVRLSAMTLVASFALAGCVTSNAPATAPAGSGATTASLPPGVTAAPGQSLVPGQTVAPGETTGTTKTPKPPKSPKPPKVTTPPTEPPTMPPDTGLPAGAITTTDAASHVGENATVCGAVQFANWVFAEPGHPTWLNLDSSYPSVTFNAVIWGEERRAWPLNGKPEVVYLGKVICVTGTIEQYSTWYQIQNLPKDSIQVIQ
jgi:hypothetical protein